MKRVLPWITAVVLSLPLAAQPQQPVPLDPSATSLPPNFGGTDFAALYKSLSIPPKDEFETTAQYEARKQKVPTGVYAFAVPLLGPAVYNADRGAFELIVGIDFAHGDGTLAKKNLLTLSRETSDASSHPATNAFGATVTVRSWTNSLSGLLIPDQYNMVNLAVPVVAEKARAIKDHLGVFAIAQIGPQSVPGRLSNGPTAVKRNATGYKFQEATMDSPTEVTTYEYAIDANVLALWVVDSTSGEILRKFDLAGKSLDPNGAPVREPVPVLPPATRGLDVFVRVKPGLTMDEVRALSAPLPFQIKKNGDFEEWWYPDKIKLRFKDGKLVNMSTAGFWAFE